MFIRWFGVSLDLIYDTHDWLTGCWWFLWWSWWWLVIVTRDMQISKILEQWSSETANMLLCQCYCKATPLSEVLVAGYPNEPRWTLEETNNLWADRSCCGIDFWYVSHGILWLSRHLDTVCWVGIWNMVWLTLQDGLCILGLMVLSDLGHVRMKHHIQFHVRCRNEGCRTQDNPVTAILFYAPWCFYSQQALALPQRPKSWSSTASHALRLSVVICSQ